MPRQQFGDADPRVRARTLVSVPRCLFTGTPTDFLRFPVSSEQWEGKLRRSESNRQRFRLVQKHRGVPGHTQRTHTGHSGTRAQKGTRITQTNLTTIQTHQTHNPHDSATIETAADSTAAAQPVRRNRNVSTLPVLYKRRYR
jgi:hypothetical protein